MGKRAARAAGRPAPAFWKFMKARRQALFGEESLKIVSDELKKVGAGISKSSLFRYEDEHGIPDVLVLHGISRVYQLSFNGVTNALRHELTQRDTSVEEIERIVISDQGWHRVLVKHRRRLMSLPYLKLVSSKNGQPIEISSSTRSLTPRNDSPRLPSDIDDLIEKLRALRARRPRAVDAIELLVDDYLRRSSR